MEKSKKWFIFFFDLFYMTALGLYIVFQSNTDPGDIIFLYVFENVYMIVGLIFFVLTVLPFFRLIRVKHLRLSGKTLSENDKSSFLNFYGYLLLFSAVILVVGGLIVVLLDQIAIEFLVEYLGDNGYSFQSIEILSKDYLFFEKEVFEPMSRLLNLDYGLLLLIIGGRYFLELVLNYASNKNFLKVESMTLIYNGIGNILAHVLIGPILVLICMIVLVIFTAIFGTQEWIVIAAVISFRLLSNALYWAFSSNITEEQDDH